MRRLVSIQSFHVTFCRWSFWLLISVQSSWVGRVYCVHWSSMNIIKSDRYKRQQFPRAVFCKVGEVSVWHMNMWIYYSSMRECLLERKPCHCDMILSSWGGTGDAKSVPWYYGALHCTGKIQHIQGKSEESVNMLFLVLQEAEDCCVCFSASRKARCAVNTPSTEHRQNALPHFLSSPSRLRTIFFSFFFSNSSRLMLDNELASITCMMGHLIGLQ